MEKIEYYWHMLENYIVGYAPKLLLAIITLIVGLWLIKKISGLLNKALKKKETDESLSKFLVSLVAILLKVLLIISVISMVGIETTSFVAILAAAGFAIGMALQGSLGNFAGGVLILLFKPFKVGDVIDAQGYLGSVNTIGIFSTILKTPDNRTIFLPNGPLAGGAITNLSTEALRRVDMTFGIGYEDDIAKAKELINSIIEKDSRILKEPAPMIAVSELADSSVNFVVRAWCESSNYWGIFFDMQETIKVEFDKAKISIPYPQTDVHVHNN